MRTHTVILPNNAQLTFAETGKLAKVRDVPDGTCFLHGSEVWEKLPGSNACLSDFDNEGELYPWIKVQILREHRTENA